MNGDSGPLLRQFRNNFRIKNDPNAPKLTIKLLRQAWDLTNPFWLRREAWKAYVALGLYTVTIFGFSVLSAWTAKLSGEQLAALAARNGARYYHYFFLSLFVGTGLSYVRQLFALPWDLMELRWRQWLTRRFINDYLTDSSYYALNRDRVVDNPDERIAIDIQQFIYYPSNILFGFIRSVSDLAVFVYVLWHFAWYLVPASAAYYIFQSIASLMFAKPQMKLGYEQRRLDGDFRFGLVNVRTNAESIAFLRGEPVEQKELFRRNDLLVENSVKTVWWGLLLNTWFDFSSVLGSALPTLLIVPLVLKGTLTLAAFPQAQVAWGRVGFAFGFFGQQASSLAYTAALIVRLHALREHCVGKARHEMDHEGTQIQVSASDRLATEHLNLETPRGERVLVSDLSFDLGPTGRLLVVGPNGVGKSSLLRGFAGLWTRGSGELHIPSRDNMMFLPQRPYMSLGPLREQVTYPESNSRFGDDQVRAVLAAVKVEYLEERFGGFNAKLDWTHVLSPGEQQRIAFARVLLRKPKLVILDEATSGIDVQGECLLYQLLRDIDAAYVSVGHRVTLYPFHDTLLDLTGEGKWLLRPVQADDGAAGNAPLGGIAVVPEPT
jgi:putative ATP-binding cassette transporter